MTLKNEVTDLKFKLASLKERIEANDEEAIKEGVALKADIEAKEKEIAQAEAKASVLEVIGKKTEENEMKESAFENLNMEALKKERGTVSTYIKAYNDNQTKPTVYENSREVATPDEVRGVRDIFANEGIGGNSYSWVVLGAREGNPATTAEGAKKPQIHYVQTQNTEALVKIAAYLKETDELLEDAPYLMDAIETRGRLDLKDAVEAYLVGELLDTSGVQQGAASISFDNILAAKQDIYTDTGWNPDALIINPADWESLLKTKDLAGQYYLGGPAFGIYGNGSYTANPRVWGLEVIQSAAVPEGECVVGCFGRGASVITKQGEGLRVEVSNSNEDDFIYNLVTVRLEERVLLAVRMPAAFEIVGTEESASGAPA